MIKHTLDETGVRDLFLPMSAPLDRVLDGPVSGRFIALIAALIQFIREDMLLGAIFVLIGTNIIDYLVGVYASQYHGEKFNLHRSIGGAIGKALGVMIVLIFVVIEVWIGGMVGDLIGETKGSIAIAIAFFFIVADVKSIDRHRISFGAKPIPFIGKMLDWLEGILAGKAGIKTTIILPGEESNERLPK